MKECSKSSNKSCWSHIFPLINKKTTAVSLQQKDLRINTSPYSPLRKPELAISVKPVFYSHLQSPYTLKKGSLLSKTPAFTISQLHSEQKELLYLLFFTWSSPVHMENKEMESWAQQYWGLNMRQHKKIAENVNH